MSTTYAKAPCLVCGKQTIIPYLDLGKHALANAFVVRGNKTSEKKYPLIVGYCTTCHLAQLVERVPPETLFKSYNYISGASKPLEAYFKDYAETIHTNFSDIAKKGVLDIGSNDGTLLKYIQDYGYKVIGVDPAKNIARIAQTNGIHTIADFFGARVAKRILKTDGPIGVITANHVIAHTDALHDIFTGINTLLTSDGVFIFEVQYLGDLLENSYFDNTYHEHMSYFSLHPIEYLLSLHNLQAFHVERAAAQGGSLRIYVARHGTRTERASVRKLREEEKRKGFTTLKPYTRFAKYPELLRKKLTTLLQKLKGQGKRIVGYGAPAKGNTLLQFCDIDSSLIDYIVDTTPTKQGKFTPGSHIPVVAPSVLHTETPDHVVILTWNYAKEIIQKEKELQKRGVVFINPHDLV